MVSVIPRRELRMCDPCHGGKCEVCTRGPCRCACRDSTATAGKPLPLWKPHPGTRHFCPRCGQCLCDCKTCRVYYPCCCAASWAPTAPRPPVTTVHNCTCAPKGALT